MNRDRLRETLARDEGCILTRHEVQGIDHIGYGINLEQELPDELLEYLGEEDEDSIKEITQEQANYLLDYFVAEAESDCGGLYADVWDSLSALRKEVLVNLGFNLGLAGLRRFRKMNTAIAEGDWEEAGRQMLDSKAARQTGERYPRLSNAFINDDETCLKLTRNYDSCQLEIEAVRGLSEYSNEELLAELRRRLAG